MIEKKLKRNANKIDKFLINFFNKQKKSSLVSPMKYGVISGGKKIRSTIIFDSGKIFRLKEKKANIFSFLMSTKNLLQVVNLLLCIKMTYFWLQV